MAEKLREACCYGDLEAISTILQSGVNVNNCNPVNGWTALHWACQRGHSAVVEMLIMHGADPLIVNHKHQTPAQLTQLPHIRNKLGSTDSALTPSSPTNTSLTQSPPPFPQNCSSSFASPCSSPLSSSLQNSSHANDISEASSTSGGNLGAISSSPPPLPNDGDLSYQKNFYVKNNSVMDALLCVNPPIDSMKSLSSVNVMDLNKNSMDDRIIMNSQLGSNSEQCSDIDENSGRSSVSCYPYNENSLAEKIILADDDYKVNDSLNIKNTQNISKRHVENCSTTSENEVDTENLIRFTSSCSLNEFNSPIKTNYLSERKQMSSKLNLLDSCSPELNEILRQSCNNVKNNSKSPELRRMLCVHHCCGCRCYPSVKERKFSAELRDEEVQTVATTFTIVKEKVLKIRVAGDIDPDFIEVRVPKAGCRYDDLLQLMCAELTVQLHNVQRIRKLPNTRLRCDADVQRLQEEQELELVTSGNTSGSDFSNQPILY